MLPEQETFFNQLHAANFGKLNRYARSSLGNPAQAEELVQDAMHDASEKIEDLMTHDNPAGWLMKNVKFKINNGRRANLISLKYSVEWDPIFGESIPDTVSVENTVERREESRLIQEALHKCLTEEELYEVKRLFIDNASHKEVAAELGISVWTSQKRLERIRGKLRIELSEILE